jgi:hypothetical protein
VQQNDTFVASRLRRRQVSNPSASLLYADHVERHGVDFFRAICQRDCEGVAAKHKRATYGVLGTAGWFKILNPTYTQKRGRREMFESFRNPSSALILQSS